MKFESGIKGGERIRDKKAWVEMKEHFKNQVDPVTGRPLVVKQSQIRAYFSRRAAKIKRDGIDAALASVRSGAADDAGEGGESDEDGLRDLKVEELKEMCRQRELKLGGKKSELIDRILEYDRKDATE